MHQHIDPHSVTVGLSCPWHNVCTSWYTYIYTRINAVLPDTLHMCCDPQIVIFVITDTLHQYLDPDPFTLEWTRSSVIHCTSVWTHIHSHCDTRCRHWHTAVVFGPTYIHSAMHSVITGTLHWSLRPHALTLWWTNQRSINAMLMDILHWHFDPHTFTPGFTPSLVTHCTSVLVHV